MAMLPRFSEEHSSVCLFFLTNQRVFIKEPQSPQVWTKLSSCCKDAGSPFLLMEATLIIIYVTRVFGDSGSPDGPGLTS